MRRVAAYAHSMGRFVYDSMATSVDLDDRTLAHLRIVIMNKLRRGESFMFTVDFDSEGISRRSFWMHAAVAMQFAFQGSREPHLNRLWIDELMKSASSPNGLVIVPEPHELLPFEE